MSFCTARRASLRTLGSSCVIIPMTFTLHPRFSNMLEKKEYTHLVSSHDWSLQLPIRNLSGCEIKVWKTKPGLNGIWTHDLSDTGAVRYCYTCSLEEHILVTMNIVVLVLNRSNELTTIELSFTCADSLHLVSKTVLKSHWWNIFEQVKVCQLTRRKHARKR